MASLYNNSKLLGLSFLAAKKNTQMKAADAQKYIDKGQTYFAYIAGCSYNEQQ